MFVFFYERLIIISRVLSRELGDESRRRTSLRNAGMGLQVAPRQVRCDSCSFVALIVRHGHGVTVNKWIGVPSFQPDSSMSAYLTGVGAVGGIPLFSRQVGEERSEGIPFATLAALNGVNLFARLNHADLMSTVTSNTQINWKVFNKSIVLIVIVTEKPSALDHVEQQVIEKTLQHIYDSLILCCGLEELVSQNIERLKRCLKSAFPLIDHFLRLLISPPTHPNLVKGCVNSLHVESHVNDFVKSLAESYSAVASSDFACIIVNGFIIAASRGWWSRLSHSKDAFLVVNLVNAISGSFSAEVQTREMPIFLPENCPDTVTRLLVSEVHPHVFMVLLCGETPDMQFIEETLEPVRYSDQHQKNLSLIRNMRGCSFLPIDERITCFALFREDHRTLLRYGQYDQRKTQEMLLMISMTSSRASEQYVRFKHTTGFALTRSPLTLILFMSNEFSLNFIRATSLKTVAQFADRKFLSQFN